MFPNSCVNECIFQVHMSSHLVHILNSDYFYTVLLNPVTLTIINHKSLGVESSRINVELQKHRGLRT